LCSLLEFRLASFLRKVFVTPPFAFFALRNWGPLPLLGQQGPLFFFSLASFLIVGFQRFLRSPFCTIRLSKFLESHGSFLRPPDPFSTPYFSIPIRVLFFSGFLSFVFPFRCLGSKNCFNTPLLPQPVSGLRARFFTSNANSLYLP